MEADAAAVPDGDRPESLEGEHPETVLRWAWENFAPSVAATSSFQTQSLPLLHMISRAAPRMPVLFLDTGFHFPETLSYRDRVVEELDLNLKVLEPKIGHDGFLQEYGELYRRNPDLCCHINKVEPLERAKAGLEAWVAGIRRDQTEARKGTPVVDRNDDGLLKVCPMVTWTEADVEDYVEQHDLPRHPLHGQGYRSIGCAPCTRRVDPDAEDARAGRWAGSQKTECGLHLDDE